MVSDSFQLGVLLRVGILLITLLALAWMAATTTWYISMMICMTVVAMEVAVLIRFASRTGHEVSRFLDAITYDDNYVTVYPGETREITAEVSETQLKEQKPVVAIEGYNTH